MHTSAFSYTVTKNYPYRWFTPVAILGGVIFLTLFSVLNFASSGYTLVTIYSTNPNTTAGTQSIDKWPSLLTSKVHSQCQPVSIPLGTQLLTSNKALTYTLTNVQSSDGTLQPSLNYLNNPLENCNVTSVTIYLDHTDNRNAAQIRFSRWGADTQGRIMCNVTLDSSGPTTVNLTVDWNPVPATVSTYDFGYRFLGRDNNTRASLWWGESLLSKYFAQVTNDMKSQESSGGEWTKVEATLTPNRTITDITALSYYNVTFRGITEGDDGGRWMNPDDSSIKDVLAANNKDPDSGPNIWSAADSLSKSLESSVLTDLGQSNAQPNILTDSNLLQHFTANFSSIKANGPVQIGPAEDDYNSLKATTGSLGVAPSTFATNYLCNVPKRKPGGDLVVSILVADLVFMTTLWTVFTFIVGRIIRRKDFRADWCEGCSSAVGKDMPLDEIAGKASDSRSVQNSEYEPLATGNPITPNSIV
ncbi:MAG: hypothetical protein M1820_004519 [Bogoriella megaspora]|nr:MAG: hypothetical protein M1820_004519 [Bogoriella megaspora]